MNKKFDYFKAVFGIFVGAFILAGCSDSQGAGVKIPADRIEKNEIAGYRIRLSDRIVADTFNRYRTLG